MCSAEAVFLEEIKLDASAMEKMRVKQVIKSW